MTGSRIGWAGLVCLVAWAPGGHAAPVRSPAGVKGALVSRLWSAAEAHRRAGRHKQCGRAFETLAKRFPRHPRADAMLFNAAACHEGGGDVRAAIRTRKGLLQRYARSRLAPTTLHYLAGCYQRVVLVADAAGAYERFTSRYPRRKEAPGSLMRAIGLRGGLGQARLVKRNVSHFIKRYGRRYPARAARAFWFWVEYSRVHGKAAAFETALGSYLRRYARRGTVDRTVEAMAKLGRIHWRRSCRIPTDNGICRRAIRVKQRGSSKRRRTHKYVVRSGVSVSTAKRYFNRALKVWAKGRAVIKIPKHAADRRARLVNLRHFAAFAAFMRAEVGLDPYLRVGAPTFPRVVGDRRKAKRSYRKYRQWLGTKKKAGNRLVKAYMNVVTGGRGRAPGKRRGDPEWSIAAVYRTGVIFRSIAQRAKEVRLPKVRGAVGSRLGGLPSPMEPAKVAARFRKKALGAFELCVQLAKRLRWHDKWERRCRTGLRELLPKKHPKAKERFLRPGQHRPTIDRAGFR